jgi:hypothetical protein
MASDESDDPTRAGKRREEHCSYPGCEAASTITPTGPDGVDCAERWRRIQWRWYCPEHISAGHQLEAGKLTRPH